MITLKSRPNHRKSPVGFVGLHGTASNKIFVMNIFVELEHVEHGNSKERGNLHILNMSVSQFALQQQARLTNDVL